MRRELTKPIHAIATAALFSAVTSAAFAVPPAPDRPLAAQTCDVAMTRLAEAQAGSPLLSPDEQAQVLRVAQADVARLCDAGQRDGLLPTPGFSIPDQTFDADRVQAGPGSASHPYLLYWNGRNSTLR